MRSKSAAIAACLMVFGFAGAQSATGPTETFQPTNFRASTSRDTWHGILIASAIVAVVGLLQDDSTLTVLGIAGVALALVETEQSRFQLRSHHGFDFAKSGPVSFGYNPWGRSSFAHGVTGARPGPYLQFTFRF